jgi:YD repeat-containing protein
MAVLHPKIRNVIDVITYDLGGSRHSLIDGTGTTVWETDGLYRVRTVTAPGAGTVEYRYDAAGKRVQLIYPDTKEVHYTYDLAGRLQTVTDWAAPARVTTYHYDRQGRYSWVNLPNGVTSAYVFDDAGRLSDLVHRREGSDLASYHYEYDPLGNRTRAVEGGSAHGQPPETPPSQFMAEQQGYMAIGLGWPDSAVNEVSYTLERSTDGQNWQVVSTLTANTLRFVDEGLTRHTDYWYRLTASNGQGGSEVHTLRTRTAFDPVIYPASGPTEDLVIDYGYDPLDRLTTADDNDERYYHYSYDAVGNRLSETTPAGTTGYVYDDANRLTSVGGVSYAWDDNGNLTGDGANTYSYDAANRLVGIVGSSLSASYTYNGLGDRVSQVENGVATSFSLDQAGGLTQVLQDGDHTYLYGNERIGQFTTGTAEYFLGDALGSVRQLIDGDGVVGVVKRYEPYGELVTSVGESSSAFGFTGEWTSS